MNEKFKSEDSDNAIEREETEMLLIYGKEVYLPRYIPSDLFIQKMQKLHTLAILIAGASSLKEIPDDIFKNMDKLVELDLSNSQLKQLPLSFSNLRNITILILRGCSRLESIPSLEDFYKLTLLDLSGASALTSIPDTIYSIIKLDLSGTLIKSLPSQYNLRNLIHLFLRGCTKITTMPHPHDYLSLEVLDLSGATSFTEFQILSFPRLKLPSLVKIDLSGTLIAQVPRFVGFYKIPMLLLRNCCHLETMPPFDLEVLDLSGSIAFKNFHDELLSDQLTALDLSRTQIQKLPVLSMHSVMVQLILRECGLLEELPHLELERLQVLDLSGSINFKTFKDNSFHKLRKLKTLNLSETQVSNLPTLSHCSELRHLILRKCLKLEELPHLISLQKLELLDLSGAISFKQFQDESLGKKEELHELNLTETQVVQIPSLSECHNVRKLMLRGCSKLEILPNLEALSRLVVLDLSGAIALVKLHYQSTGLKSDYLQVLDFSGTYVSDLSFISGCIDLRQLSLRDCPNILTLPPLNELTRLEELDLSRTEFIELSFLSGCKSLCQLLLNDCSNIQELTSLKEHTGLEVLDLSGTKTEDFSLLSGFHKLRELSLRGCLNLETLSFEGLHNLQKVDLSYNPIEVLPSSFSRLRNLRVLLLTDCSSLQTLPLKELLPKLEVLDLSCTNVREFPNDISALTHLRFLKLQEENSLWEFHNGRPFKKFHFCLFSPKESIRENDVYLQGQQYFFKDIYYQTSHIPSITDEPDKFFKVCGFQNFPVGIEEVLVHVELLYLKKNNFLTRLSDVGALYVKEMRECWIENCSSMECVFDDEETRQNDALGMCLENLWVSKLSELKTLFRGIVQPWSFRLLKHLYIECCPSLITVFSSHLELKSLEVLKIKFCDKIAHIFGELVLGEEMLPKLVTLTLIKLPELQSICGGFLPSLKNLRVIGCLKLKNLPISGDRTSYSVKIKGEAIWWKDLLEDERTKSHQRFSPF
ncbi:Suppressor of npr1-1 [Thalictrum thalictroides]|uniref:Suppressor of npr1-1 n=1 Tax=Thalictrum thalictroides TaxID=46969 RepID=A0A7J6WV88_THATH|nr:Suppressor of npr1-1 [Thalictrum thalictroides]